jgi:hypothetical protein
MSAAATLLLELPQNPRKRRLFSCACCRSIEHLLRDARSRTAVEIAEKYADGRATEQERERAWVDAKAVTEELKQIQDTDPTTSIRVADISMACAAEFAVQDETEYGAGIVAWNSAGGMRNADEFQTALLRDIFGPPDVRFAEEWRTPTVVELATRMYEERRFDEMPALADALKEVGCGDDPILSHCRSGGLHVRGCWVVDLILGKE